MRVKMIVAYDGTNYCGWQIQPNGVTIEQKLNEALSALLGEEIKVTGASRTDAGVHSLGNVCIFDTNTRMPAEKISYALNQRLPEDIVVTKSEEVSLDWHPRYQNSLKTYEYHILNTKTPVPTKRLYNCFVSFDLDVNRMRQGAQYLLGEHDFAAFCCIRTNAKTTVRTVTDLQIQQNPLKPEEITIRITGNGFLYNMVRIMVGTLLPNGREVLKPGDLTRIIESGDRKRAGITAPAAGLYLTKVSYTPYEPKDGVTNG